MSNNKNKKESEMQEFHDSALHCLNRGVLDGAIFILKKNTEYYKSVLKLGECYEKGIGVKKIIL